ncbi:MAG: Crp/Fnr family transcriptional regulator [Acidobacteriota bacterium]
MGRARALSAEPGITFDEAVDRVPFLRELTSQQLDLLRPIAELRVVARGQPLFSLDEPSHDFQFVVRGHVKMLRSRDDGREVILDIRGPGDLLCAGAVSSFAPYCCAAHAISGDVVALSFPRRDLHRLLEESPAAAAQFFRQATAHEMRLTDRIVELTSGHVEQRIAALLLRLAEQVGVPDVKRAVRIPVKLSRQDLADLCGTTLETAIRTMTSLGRDGVVTTVARGFVITDRARLEALARGEPKGDRRS